MQKKPLKVKTKHRWQTMWLTIGPRLPRSEIRPRENISLAPLSEQAFERLKNETIPVPKATLSADAYVVRYPPRDVVRSRYRLQVDVLHEDEEQAIGQASRIVDQLLASFSLAIPGGRYHAEMRKVRRPDQHLEFSAWSQSLTATPLLPPQQTQQSDIDQIFKLFDTIQSNEAAQNAYIHLMTAWQLQDTAGSKPLQRSILQHYILCMEAVINGIMVEIRNKQRDRIKLEEREFAKKFAEEIANRADKPEAIRKASTALRDISLVNMLPSIEKVASLLGLNAAEKELAKELYRFRSRSISHPGRAKQGEIDVWLRSGPTVEAVGKADMVARTFLTKYCHHISP